MERTTNRIFLVALVGLVGIATAGLYMGLTAGEDGGADGSAEAGSRAGAAAGSSGPASRSAYRRGGESGGSLAIPAAVVEFPSLDGDSASLARYEGQVVLLNLWGTWCPPCRREIPDLVEVHGKLQERGGTVVGLAVDSGTPAEIRDFVDEFGVNYPIWYSRGARVMEHYDAVGYPTTMLIDRDGVIRERWLGPQTAESLMEDLEPYLAE